MSEQVHTPYLGPNHRAVKGRLWTIGHSTRSIEEFVGLLKSHGVDRVLDVRLLPGSRRYPHFNAEALAASLSQAGIDYRHLPNLGGRRKACPDSENLGWKNASFRGYADYMAIEGFRLALAEAMALATERPSALLCAEAVPWRCHRSLIGDALLAQGWEVLDIIGPGAAKPHRLTAFAKVEGEKVSYPAEGSAQKSLPFEKRPD
ncbi:MAG TPA: DUF488 domain-containing protein [bacterium]|nr:DUF488 domain-containing protein [bacterium]